MNWLCVLFDSPFSGGQVAEPPALDTPASSACDRTRPSRSDRASSTRTIGTTSRVVLVRNASSAPNRSSSPEHLLADRDARPAPTSKRNSRVMPASSPGVERRRQRRAVLHDEQVRLRALGQLAAVVAHHAFERAAPERLLHRQRVVQQVVRLDERVHRARVIPDDRHERDLHAALEHLAAADRPAA